MIPGDEPSSGHPYLQECKQGIVNDFNCSMAVVPKIYAVLMGICSSRYSVQCAGSSTHISQFGDDMGGPLPHGALPQQ